MPKIISIILATFLGVGIILFMYRAGDKDADLIVTPETSIENVGPDFVSGEKGAAPGGGQEILSGKGKQENIEARLINPTIDRFGVPSSDLFVLTPEQLETIRLEKELNIGAASAEGFEGGSDTVRVTDAGITDATGTAQSPQRIDDGPIDSEFFGPAPEDSSLGSSGLAPEEEGIQLPAVPPHATDIGDYDLGPGATDTGDSGPPPEGEINTDGNPPTTDY